jgi:hypothetical protein
MLLGVKEKHFRMAKLPYHINASLDIRKVKMDFLRLNLKVLKS